MNWLDGMFQTVLGIIALTVMNRFIYHDSLLMSFCYAIAVIAAFWIGRGSVRLLKRRTRLRRALDE